MRRCLRRDAVARLLGSRPAWGCKALAWLRSAVAIVRAVLAKHRQRCCRAAEGQAQYCKSESTVHCKGSIAERRHTGRHRQARTGVVGQLTVIALSVVAIAELIAWAARLVAAAVIATMRARGSKPARPQRSRQQQGVWGCSWQSLQETFNRPNYGDTMQGMGRI